MEKAPLVRTGVVADRALRGAISRQRKALSGTVAQLVL
jgi:hypothetical protein